MEQDELQVTSTEEVGRSQGQIHQDDRPIVTWLLIAANIAMYLIPSIAGESLPVAFKQMALVPVDFGIRNAWVLVTSMFLHGSLGHLLTNMYSLYVLGSMCEQLVGRRRYLVAYFGGGIAGGLLFVLVRWKSVAGAIGASGAIFSLMGLYGAFLLALGKRTGRGGGEASSVVMSAIRNFFLVLALNALLVPVLGNIAWEGHLGGFLFGFLMGLPMVLGSGHIGFREGGDGMAGGDDSGRLPD